jgi:hypothetical protein
MIGRILIHFVFFSTLVLIAPTDDFAIGRGPVFTAISYWEALSAGAMNVIDLFLLADILNGTSVEPYVNDLNSQHPYSGYIEEEGRSRHFSSVYLLEDLKRIANLRNDPIKAYKLKPIISSAEFKTNVIFILYGTMTAPFEGTDCARLITQNETLKAEHILGKKPNRVLCLKSTLSILPDELVSSHVVNVIVNWHGTGTTGSRVRWYASKMKKVSSAQIFRTIRPEIAKSALHIAGAQPRPYLTIHMRIGRILSFRQEGILEAPDIYLAIGHLATDCLVDHAQDMIDKYSIKSIIVLDDFDQMDCSPDAVAIKERMQSRIRNQLINLNSESTQVQYSIGQSYVTLFFASV